MSDNEDDPNGQALDFLYEFRHKFEELRLAFNAPNLNQEAKKNLYKELEAYVNVYTAARNSQVERDPSS